MKIKNSRAEFDQLKAVFDLFESLVKNTDWVCGQKCAACCTCNVTMTSLEAQLMVSQLSDDLKQSIKDKIKAHVVSKKYVPKLTFNRFARLCRQGKDIPEEENDPLWGRCALLETKLCMVYEYRPFGCRALLSSVDCKENGYARIPPFVLTLNNLFLQYIEHLDHDGFSGNLSDMLALYLTHEAETSDPEKIAGLADERFTPNEKISVLMIPPEHRGEIGPVIEKLNGILT